MAHRTTQMSLVALTNISSDGGYSGCAFNTSAPQDGETGPG
jgi:hypothetical protein